MNEKKQRLAILLFAVISVSMMVSNVIWGISSIPGYDFRLRYHEVECLRQGIDPYDIISKKLESKEYALFATPAVAQGAKALHVYTPWEYTWFLPLSFLSKNAAGAIFLFLSILAYIGVSIYAYYEGLAFRGKWEDGLFAATAALFLGASAGKMLSVANYGAINAFWILLLILALSHGHDVMAGIVWSFLMIKPQIGMLFVIPLLIKRKYITIGVAVASCLICSLPPALMCGKNPLILILEVPLGGAFVADANGTMLIPSQVFNLLKGKVPGIALMLVSMLVGAGICAVLTWRLRKNNRWLVIITPTVVCTLLWSFCHPHDRVILWLTQFLLALTILKTQKANVRYYCFMLIFLTAWPYWDNNNILSKMIRRISLVMLVYGCWILPKLNIFEKQDANLQ
ncbi:MAG: DUF2029 domain-containing protein [Victivallales bacterium]|nr:DUF2029 domain-containing protein [Victivallales bacterium]